MLNELNLTPELLEKAKSATSATALLALAQENGITLTTEEAAAYYTQLHPKEGALSDDELDNVSGGGLCSDPIRKRAIDYVIANYCNKDPGCYVFSPSRMYKVEVVLDVPKRSEQLCRQCKCKPEIDVYCQSQGWPLLEVYTNWY